MKRTAMICGLMLLVLIAVLPAMANNAAQAEEGATTGDLAACVMPVEAELPLFEFRIETQWGCPSYTISCWNNSQCANYCGSLEFAVCYRFCCACSG